MSNEILLYTEMSRDDLLVELGKTQEEISALDRRIRLLMQEMEVLEEHRVAILAKLGVAAIRRETR